MATQLHADLLPRPFGSALLHVPTLGNWLKEKELHMNAGPLLSDCEFIQVEMLLCAVGEAAIEGITHEQASAIVANDSALRMSFIGKGHSQETKEMLTGKLATYDAGDGEEILMGAHFTISSAAHRKWRELIAKSVDSGELVLLDFASKLPLVPPLEGVTMLNKNDVLALRDLALEHLPKVMALRDSAAQHSRRSALQAVVFSPLGTQYSPASTAIELQASRLLALVGEHPETHHELLIDDVAGDESLCITVEQAIEDAQQKRPLIEKLLLIEAQELCRLSGAPMPHSIVAMTQSKSLSVSPAAAIPFPVPPVSPTHAAPASEDGAPAAADSWKAEARRIADELFNRDTANHCRDSLDGYSKRVAKELKSKAIKGPHRKYVSSGSVKREALQGQHWWRSKEK